MRTMPRWLDTLVFGPGRWYAKTFFKEPKKPILLTTTMTLPRPFEPLGMVSSYPGAAFQDDRERRLKKNALKKYPDADAVIGVIMMNRMVLSGTAVRYTD
jgi:hypothetical protein